MPPNFWIIFLGAAIAIIVAFAVGVIMGRQSVRCWRIRDAYNGYGAPVRWRGIDEHGMPIWVDDEREAVCFARREPADHYSGEDPDDVRIVTRAFLNDRGAH